MPSKSSPPAVQVFWGTDDLESLKHLLAWQELFRQRQAASSIVTISADGPVADVRAELLEAGGTISLFTDAKMVVVKHFLSIKDEVTEKILGELIAQAKGGELVILLWQRGAPDKRRGLVKRLLAAVKEGQVAISEFKAPEKSPERQEWLRGYWRRQGSTFDEASVRALETATAGSPFGVLRQLAEVILLAGSPRIEEALTKSYLPARHRPEDFGINDAIQRGDRAAALAQLATLSLSREDVASEAIQSFGALVWLIESGWKLREALDRGTAPSQLGVATGIHPFVAGKMSRLVQRHPVTSWQGWFQEAAAQEWEAKHGRTDFPTACEKLIWSLTS